MARCQSNTLEGSQSTMVDTSDETATMNKILESITSTWMKANFVHRNELSALLEKIWERVHGEDFTYSDLRLILLQCEGDTTERYGIQVPEFNISMMTLYGQQKGDLFISLPDVETVKSKLAERKFIMYVERFEHGFVSDLTSAENSMDSDETFLDINAFEKLKLKDRKAWELKWGCLEYSGISQRLVQAIMSLDLQLAVTAAQNFATEVLSIAEGWSKVYRDENYTIRALERLFESDMVRPRDILINERTQASTLINCTVCNRNWGYDFYGHGVILHYTSVVDVFWTRDKGDDVITDDSTGKSKTCLFTIECTSSQGFPLGRVSDDCFRDSYSTVPGHRHYENELNTPSLLVDYDLGAINFSFYEPLYEGPFHCGTRRDGMSLNGTIGNHKHLKTIEDAISELECYSTQSSIENEVYAWGCNDNKHLGVSLKNDEKFCVEPTPILFDRLSARETVTSLACSSRHVLALTNMGTVYSCGDGSHGQLGHGNREYCRYLRLISKFAGGKNIITAISAGSNGISSHSAAIDANHHLFTWGSPVISGHVIDRHEECAVPKKLETLEGFRNIKISCGSGYTLVLVEEDLDNPEAVVNERNRKVISWGLLSHGRLGIGKPEREVEKTYFGQRKYKDSKSYESVPSIVTNLSDKNIVDISAGTDHALALSESGEVFAWGANALGQCGATDIEPLHLRRNELQRHRDRYNGIRESQPLSIFDDVWVPRKITQFGHSRGTSIKSISAGGFHSAAVDKNGLVYTWGGGGNSSCLGHGENSRYEFGNNEKNDSLRRTVLTMSGGLRIPKWAEPRVVKCLKETKIVSISLGKAHCAAVSKTGQLFIWGDNAMEIQNRMRTEQSESVREEYTRNHFPTTVPVNPNERVFNQLEGKRTHQVVCSASATFCVASDDAIGNSLGSKLYESMKEEDTLKSTIDCVLIAGGRQIYCHGIILSQRSSVMKQLLMTRDRAQDFSSLVELVISGINHDVMKNIFCFIYTDRIPDLNLLPFERLLSIWNAAERFKLQKLSSKCQQILEIDHGYKIDNSPADESEIEIDHNSVPSFALQMSRALEDKRFVDVHILVEDKIICAHECVLRCASDHFDMLLDNARSEHKAITTLVIPGTYVQGVQLLFYLYTGFLPGSSAETGTYSEIDLVNGLTNAHRYQLEELKSYCDSTILVTPQNATKMLLLGIEVDSTRLKIQSMNLLSKTLGRQVETDALREKFFLTLAQCPHNVKDELFEMIKDAKKIGYLIPQDRKDLASSIVDRSLQQKAKMEEKMAKDLVGSEADGLSARNICVLLVFLATYMYLQKAVSLGAFVPVVNASVLVLTAINLISRIQ